MYLDEGRCAHCHKQLDDTYRTAPYNTNFDHLLTRHQYRPYFCSEAHVAKTLEVYLPADYGERGQEEDLYWLRLRGMEYDPDTSEGMRLFESCKQELESIRATKRFADEDAYQDAWSHVLDEFNEAAIKKHEAENPQPLSSHDEYFATRVPQSEDMSIDYGTILARARIESLPTVMHMWVETLLCYIKLADKRSDYYSKDPHGDLAAFLKDTLQQIGPAVNWEASWEAPRVGSLTISELAAQPIAYFERAYNIFRQTHGLTASIETNLRKFVGARDDKMSDAELWQRVDRDKPAREIAQAVFGESPLGRFLELEFPVCASDQTRYEHTHILGPSGSGKTTLIQDIVLKNLARPNPPAMVIIDPKGLMTDRIQKLNMFNPHNGKLKDRLVIVDPTEDPPPALNMFDPKSDPSWTEAQRRSIINQAINSFAFVFSSTGSAITAKQLPVFAAAVRLIFSMKGNISRLLDFLEDPAKSADTSVFAPEIARLDPLSQRLIRSDYYSSQYGETRQQLKARIYGLLQYPEIEEMLRPPIRTLDIHACLQNRKIVLVNTAMNRLGAQASALIGRYLIALTLNAAYARISLPKDQWNPAYLIIDEFQEFADEEKTPELLRLAREYNLGCVLAHQTMHGMEFSESLRNAISTNTTIKYTSSPEGIDIGYMARDLGCKPEYLKRHVKNATHANFACKVRGVAGPFSVSIPFGAIEKEPQMSGAALNELLARNRKALGGMPEPEQTLPPTSVVEKTVDTIMAPLAEQVVPSEKPPAAQTSAASEDGWA